MDKEALRKRLLTTFLGELDEHVQALNRDLLALERSTGDGRDEILVSLFRTAHSLKGAARSVGVQPIELACHRLEHLLGRARDGQQVLEPDAIQLLYSAADAFKDAGERLRSDGDLSTGLPPTLLRTLDDVVLHSSTSTRKAPTSGARASSPVMAAPAVDPVVPPASPEGFTRVATEKLDALVAASSELLIARRRLTSRLADVVQLLDEIRRWRSEWRHAEPPFRKLLASKSAAIPKRARAALEGTDARLKALEHTVETLSALLASEHRGLERAASVLDDDIRRVRLFPFSHACEGLERTVRDLAHGGSKQVVLVSEGADVQLDRFVLDRLKNPLLHLVRNAVDHGIETPDERGAAGKAPEGRVTVSAALRSNAVEIVIADDGRGLDMQGIRALARRKKIAIPEDERDVARLVFLPGFSTAPLVTELSGRGIGLDVVKHQVESLHGQVDISSSPGIGTRVALTVPLTLTTIHALLLEAAGHLFALPVAHISRLLRATSGDFASAGGRDVVLSDSGPIPVASLAHLLGIQGGTPRYDGNRAPLVVVAAGPTHVALLVDRLVVEDEILIKNLGARLRRVRHFAGATILPSGRVALILNTADLVRSATSRAPTPAIAAALAHAGSKARRRLLLAEDSVTTRSLEKSILEAAGYDVVAAADGKEAWRLLEERGADLVVADVEMPRLDGFGLCQAIRRSSRFRDLPVVLVTALESDADKARGLEVGADAYLAKSAFDQRQLIETINHLL